MSDTFSKIYIHIVFGVKFRQPLIKSTWEDEMYKYITGLINNKGQKLIAINGMPDHIHVLIRLRPNCCISDLVREIKKSSTNWIKERNLTPFKFSWQEGYGVFSCNYHSVETVVKYIKNQKTHHQKNDFEKEYRTLLDTNGIEYKEEYLF